MEKSAVRGCASAAPGHTHHGEEMFSSVNEDHRPLRSASWTNALTSRWAHHRSNQWCSLKCKRP